MALLSPVIIECRAEDFGTQERRFSAGGGCLHTSLRKAAAPDEEVRTNTMTSS